ncbi:MAG: hypothetical protein LBU50_03670, partial [Cellulomonas sp.]|nr:hypothetical protein [Cellulomonas sp.]
ELAAGLGITGDDLVGAWRCTRSDLGATGALVPLVATTGTQTQVDRLAGNLLAQGWPGLAVTLRPRMGQTAVAAAVRTVLDQGISQTHLWCQADAPTVEVGPAVLDSTAFRQLCGDRRVSGATSDSPPPAVHEANTLALMCPPDVAAQAVERLRAAGVSPQHLDLFVLSAELRPPSEGA